MAGEALRERDGSTKRGGHGVAVDLEVDARQELRGRIRSGVETEAPCRYVHGEIAVHQDGGANDLRGEEREDRACAPHDV